MGGAVVGSVIASIVVSKAVTAIGSKIGLSDSTAELLGVAAGGVAGMYAGGMVGGGSTAKTAELAGATGEQVGTQLPAGYGGPTNPTGSGFSGTGPTTMGVQASGGMATGSAGPAVNPQASRGALSQSMEVQNFQAPATPPPENLVSRTNVQPAQGQGMLSQGVTRGAPNVSQPPAQSQTSQAIKQQAMGGPGAGEEDNWWKRLFSPEKTMDMAMAAMQGYGESKQRKWELEYPEKLKQERADEWDAAYGGGSASINRQFPSGY